MKELKELLKKYRVEELAVKLGVSASTVFKWKAGKGISRLASDRVIQLHKSEKS